jgi:hypothetical protein
MVFLGMSHAISVLRAWDANFSASHQNWNSGTAHQGWESIQGLSAQEPSLAFLIAPYMGWSAQLQKSPQGDTLAANPEFWDLLDQLSAYTGPKVMVSMLGGNEYSVLSLVEHPRPFDFEWPGDARYPLIPGRQVIALQTVERLLERQSVGTLAMLTALRYKLPDWQIMHVMPPPPIASETHIRRETEEYFRQTLQVYGIAPLSLRMKFYKAYCQWLERAMQPLNISALQAPPEALEDSGATSEAFALGCTHANDRYGALVTAQIQRTLGAPHASV